MEYFSNSQFRNKTYLIFGGSSGIGLSIGKRLHSLGAKIIIAGRSAEKISQESGLGEGFLGKFIDFNSDSSIENFLNDLPSIDGGVVWSPGLLGTMGLFYQLPNSELSDQIKLGPQGFLLIMKTLVRKRILKKGSSVVVISAIASHVNPLASSNYNAGKAALTALAISYARELAQKKKGIRINVVSYGYIETKLVEGIDGINKNQKQSHTLLSIPPGDDIRVTGPVLYLLSAT